MFPEKRTSWLKFCFKNIPILNVNIIVQKLKVLHYIGKFTNYMDQKKKRKAELRNMSIYSANFISILDQSKPEK